MDDTREMLKLERGLNQAISEELAAWRILAMGLLLLFLVTLAAVALTGCSGGAPPGYLGDCDEMGMCAPGLTCTASYYASARDVCVARCDRRDPGYCQWLMGTDETACSDPGPAGDGECVLFCDFTSYCPWGTRCNDARCVYDDAGEAVHCRVCVAEPEAV